MRPNVSDPFEINRKVATYRKHLDALVTARVSLYEAYLRDQPIDVWVTRIHQLNQELNAWPMAEEPVHREEYYRRLTAKFNG